MMLRLNKALALGGLGSRRGVEEMIWQGYVRVNGQVASTPALQVEPGKDEIQVHGKRLVLSVEPPKTEIWALYKPKYCVSTLFDPQERECLLDHLPKTSVRLFPIGRLDYDTEGLMLLTNHGELALRLSHPAYHAAKVYLVKVKGVVASTALAQLKQGVVIDGKRREGVRVCVLHQPNDKTWLEVVLYEGVQHMLKKLFATIGHRVLKIKRVQMGSVLLGELRPRESRRLSPQETDALLTWSAQRSKR